jgi:Domain of unknown function (DUF4190)
MLCIRLSWVGVCALLPYLLALILSYIERRTDQLFFEAEFIVGLFCFFLGILLGSTALIAGIVAIRQIHNSQNAETGTSLAVLGIVLGLSAVVSNILFLFTIFSVIMFA